MFHKKKKKVPFKRITKTKKTTSPLPIEFSLPRIKKENGQRIVLGRRSGVKKKGETTPP